MGSRLALVLALATTAVSAQAPDSYPKEALRLRQEGRVVMRLSVDTAGRVSACTVAESSGSASLDADACDKALKRVQFNPARGPDGKSIESTYMLPVRYVLPR